MAARESIAEILCIWEGDSRPDKSTFDLADAIVKGLGEDGFVIVPKDALENLKAIAAKGTQHSIYISALKFLHAAHEAVE